MTIKPAIYNDFVIYQVATFNEVLTIKNSLDLPINLTGYTARMKIKTSHDASSALVELTTENGGIILGGIAGTVILNISATASAALVVGTYLYDLELVSGATVNRYLQGLINISSEVTK